MNSSKNHQHKSHRITNHTLITPSSYITTCQRTAGNVPSLILKQLQAVPEIVLCPILWRLSILEKRHCPLTTQAIKKPYPPFIIISMDTLLCSHCALLPARGCNPQKNTTCSTFLHVSRWNSRAFANACQRPCEKDPKHTFLQPIWWQEKSIPSQCPKRN